MSRAAWDLQVQATAHSASCGHPGFVPDDYLEHLDGLRIETTITAAELCTSGMWERIDGGYRVLDWEAVEVCLDQVRERRRGGGGRAGPGLGTGPRSPGTGPDGHADGGHAAAVRSVRNPLGPHRARGPGTCPPSGSSGPAPCKPASCGNARQDSGISWSRASPRTTATATLSTPAGPGRIAWAFRPLLRFAQVHTAGFYDDAGFCQDCDAPYCYQHWRVSESGYGYCPRGHGKSLDPHWSPLAVDH